MTKEKAHQYSVSHKHWLKLEEVARQRRQATGALFSWTDALRQAIDEYCAKHANIAPCVKPETNPKID